MTIADVMSMPVTTVSPVLPATKALDLMARKRIHHLVVKDGARIVGVVSDRDGSAAIGAALLHESSVADIMSTDVATIEPTAAISRAAWLMQCREVGCLPVLEGRRLVGILTRSDLVDLIAAKRIS